MRELALFAGAGGGLLGTRLLGWRPICAVEFNPYRREVLLRRQADGLLELFPIWDDINTFDGKPWCGKVDVVTGGFPCQPFSPAGKREADQDARNMWPQTVRIIREVQPRFCFLENVPGLLSAKTDRHPQGYFGQILRDLAESGYVCRWDCISAAAVGALHQRKRLWILAYSSKVHGLHESKGKISSNCRRHELRRGSSSDSATKPMGWEVEPKVGRMVDGLANGLESSLEAIGDGQVPAVVVRAWCTLSEGLV